MKNVIQLLAGKFGYRVIRASKPNPDEDPFSAMERLISRVRAPVIFDVGAHHGKMALAFRERFPTSTVYAFEPFKQSFDILQANTAADKKVIALNFGLSDRVGLQTFHANISAATNSLLATDKASSETWGGGLLETRDVIQAKFETVDSAVALLQVPRIDILKLDVQGAEHLVMAGAMEAGRRRLIDVIYTEVITQPTYMGQQRFDRAMTPFYDGGFNLYNIYNVSLSDDGRLRQLDAIFTRG
jgi:FkbM family methyltransferase